MKYSEKYKIEKVTIFNGRFPIRPTFRNSYTVWDFKHSWHLPPYYDETIKIWRGIGQ